MLLVQYLFMGILVFIIVDCGSDEYCLLHRLTRQFGWVCAIYWYRRFSLSNSPIPLMVLSASSGEVVQRLRRCEATPAYA